MTPAEHIKAARAARGWTQAKTSEVTGIPLPTLEAWERGTRTPKPYSLPGILEHIRTSQEARP